MNKIIFNFYNFCLGGIQRRLVDITNYIVENEEFNDWEVHLVFREKRSFNFTPKLIKSSRIIIHYKPEISILNKNIPFPIYLLWLAIVLKPKVIMGNLEIMSCYAVFVKLILFWKKIRIVINQGNILSFDIGDKLDERWVKFCYPKADKVMVQTKYAKSDLLNKYKVPENKIQIVQNWTFVSLNEKNKIAYDLIYCGRFSEQKNLTVMLSIVKQVVKSLPNTKMLIMGNGSEKNKIKTLIKDYKLEQNVDVKKTSHKVHRYLSESKIFILTSHYEGHPVTLLEAMACKTVPVILRYPGVEEYLINGKTGYIENIENDMVKRIISLLNNDIKRKKIAFAAATEVKNTYNVKNLQKYIKALFPNKYE